MSKHSISNKIVSISVDTLGAELTSLKSSGVEFLWQSDRNVWPRYAPVLFPIVGKLKDNKYKIGSEIYSLPQHGFARDNEFTLIEKNETALEFELTATEETLRSYPFHFSFRIRYELQDSTLKVKYLVFNPDKNNLLFSVGAHPGFNCKRVSGETLSDFYLEFENKKGLIVEKLNDGLLSGETSLLKLDSGKLQLSAELFENDALVFKNTQIESVKLCSVKSKQQILMKCKDWPYFGIWTKNGSDAFVCLEPWHGITDTKQSLGNFSSKEGIIELRQNGKFGAYFSIEIIG